MLESAMPETFDISQSSHLDEIAALHATCGVYTRADMAGRILDEIGWKVDVDLAGARLLEPAAGNGIFVVEAASRLLASELARGRPLEIERLRDRITAFELLDAEATSGRDSLRDLLISRGLSSTQACELAAVWLRTGDFLLQTAAIGPFSHVAGNPPYARWSKIPAGLRVRYEKALQKHAAKGDLFLPFLDRGIELLKTDGRLGFLCSDRWKFMAFAEDFRRAVLPQVDLVLNEPVEAAVVYQRAVDIYPSVLVLEKRGSAARVRSSERTGKTLEELGFGIRVGPALGCTPAFVLEPGEDDVESELLAPFLRASDLRNGQLSYDDRRIICMHGEDGRLLDLANYPRTLRRLSKFKQRLSNRSIVDKGAPWYRPIDTVQAHRWRKPKLLVPELSKNPRAVLDISGAVPSHGIYAIVPESDDADIEALAARLSGDGLLKAVEGLAPMVKGGYLRCYKTILERVVIDRG